VLACSSARVSLCDARSFLAFAAYLAFACALFGRTLFRHFSYSHIGAGPDAALMIWSLAWWPHAIANHLNPFLTHAIWAPSGLNLTWQTSVPFAAIIASPLTLTLGPVAAYNILCLVSIPFDAWCAFVLCRYLSRSYWPSLFGGYIFGFSAFFLGHLTFGHLHLLLAFPVPLIAYFTALRLNNEMSTWRFLVIITVLLVAQFLQSLEIFTSMTMLGAVFLAMSWWGANNEIRARLLRLTTLLVLGYGLTLIVVSPYLYYFFTVGFTRKPIWPASLMSADLLNFIVPSRADDLGRLAFLNSIWRTFPPHSISESGCYFGLPLLAIVFIYARSHWREPLSRPLLMFLIFVCVLSLGPILHIWGHPTVSPLPWWLFEHMPIVTNIPPVRLSMYAFLCAAIIASFWFDAASTERWVRPAFAGMVVLFTLPNLSSAFWTRAVNTPPFFQSGVYRSYISKGESVLILPYGDNADDMLWQAQVNMYFVMPQGMAPYVQQYERRRWPIVNAFLKRSYLPEAPEQLKAFLAAYHVDWIVITDEHIGTWRSLFSTLGVPPMRVAGVWLYKLHPDREHDWDRGLPEMRARFDEERLSTLILAANEYLSKGGRLESITTVKALDLKLISPGLLFGPAVVGFEPTLSGNSLSNTGTWLAYGLWLSPWPGDRVSVGEFAWYPAVVPLIERFRGITSEIYFPYPGKLEPHAVLPKSQADGFLLMAFTREQLARAAKLLETPATPSAQRTSRADTSVYVAMRPIRE
jgi:hypothetical protein